MKKKCVESFVRGSLNSQHCEW